MVESSARRVLGKANSCCGVGLGVAIDQKCRLFDGAEAGSKVNSCCGLAYAAFLISDRDDSRQEHLDGRKLSKAVWLMQEVSMKFSFSFSCERDKKSLLRSPGSASSQQMRTRNLEDPRNVF